MQFCLTGLWQRAMLARGRKQSALSKETAFSGQSELSSDSETGRSFGWTLALCLTATLASLAVIGAAAAGDDQPAYQKRDDVMKELGRSFYTNIGRVASGRTAYSKDTVASAENVLRIVPTLSTLFPQGSDVPESHLKPEIFTAQARVDEILAAVTAGATALMPAVKTGDKAKIAAAYKTLETACVSCHDEFRKPYE